MIKIKVIDLLNKIANREIDKSQKGQKYEFAYGDYCTIEDFIKRYVIDDEVLNCEVEIIEEDKKIPENIGYQVNADGTFYLNNKKYNSEPIKILSKKIYEIIDYLEENKE